MSTPAMAPVRRPGQRRARRRLFTLLELIVVIVILGILAAIAVVGYNAVIGRSKVAALETRNASVAREVAAILAFDDGTTPEEALEEAVEDLPAVTAVLFQTSNGYTITDQETDGPNTFSYATDGTTFMFMSRLDVETYVVCQVDTVSMAASCAATANPAAKPSGWSAAQALAGDNNGDGEVNEDDGAPIDFGFSGGGGGPTTTAPEETTTTTTSTTTTLPPAVFTLFASDNFNTGTNDPIAGRPFPTAPGGGSPSWAGTADANSGATGYARVHLHETMGVDTGSVNKRITFDARGTETGVTTRLYFAAPDADSSSGPYLRFSKSGTGLDVWLYDGLGGSWNTGLSKANVFVTYTVEYDNGVLTVSSSAAATPATYEIDAGSGTAVRFETVSPTPTGVLNRMEIDNVAIYTKP